jgi:2-methylisocitrate lyase-like PEP mutase family enzyme
MTQASRFRDLLNRDGMVVAPGAYDCITAKLIEQAGFAAVYMTGAGTAATLGYPDFGLVTMSEMVANAGRIVAAVELPVVADADTGYGNELNVFRTVREFERSGVAGIHIEDQEFPKKCGHLEGKQIIPREGWLAKIRAAAAARRDRDFTIIAPPTPARWPVSKRPSRALTRLSPPAPTWLSSRRPNRAKRLRQCPVSSRGRASSMSCGAARHQISICARPRRWATSSRSCRAC